MDDDLNKSLIHNVSILYVEDEETVRESLARFLKRRFSSVTTADDGKEGLELFEKHFHDIVISDIQMPVMDGFEMIKCIKDLSPETPVIITTAFNEPNYLMKAIELRIDAYIKKPIIKDDLLNAVFKSATCISKRKDSDLKMTLVQSVLDSQSEFTMVFKMDNLRYVNNMLFNLFGFCSFDEFFVYNEHLKDSWADSSTDSTQSDAAIKWIQKMAIHPERQLQVFFKIHGEKALKPYNLKFRQTGDFAFLGISAPLLNGVDNP